MSRKWTRKSIEEIVDGMVAKGLVGGVDFDYETVPFQMYYEGTIGDLFIWKRKVDESKFEMIFEARSFLMQAPGYARIRDNMFPCPMDGVYRFYNDTDEYIEMNVTTQLVENETLSQPMYYTEYRWGFNFDVFNALAFFKCEFDYEGKWWDVFN